MPRVCAVCGRKFEENVTRCPPGIQKEATSADSIVIDASEFGEFRGVPSQ